MKFTNEMITNKFVRLVEENNQAIVEHFMNDVLKHNKTVSFRNFDQQTLYNIGSRICKELSSWVAKDLPKEKVEEYYIKIGRERKSQGFFVSEVFQALVILKRHMWLFIRDNLENNIEELSQALALNDRVVLFFDRATRGLLLGFEEDERKLF